MLQHLTRGKDIQTLITLPSGVCERAKYLLVSPIFTGHLLPPELYPHSFDVIRTKYDFVSGKGGIVEWVKGKI